MGYYHRLSLMEREELSRMLATGHSLRAAAHVLGRAPSTLSRELARHRTSPQTYRAVAAHHRQLVHGAQRYPPRGIQTPLMIAATAEVEALLDSGASANEKDPKTGNTARQYAEEGGHTQITGFIKLAEAGKWRAQNAVPVDKLQPNVVPVE